jgi:hypothetical protein
MKRCCRFSCLLFCLALLPWLGAQAGAQSLSKGQGDLRVMTYNVNEGTDYNEVQAAKTQMEFLFAVGQTITQVRATDPATRMRTVAKQIIAAGPALVSLQELDQWATGSFNPITGACGPVSVEFDLLPELMSALKAQGAHYEIAHQAQNWAFPPTPGLIPPGTFFCVQIVDSIAILARTDNPKLTWTNPQGQLFENILYFPSPVGYLPFPRGWISIDATFNGRQFRFIGTHLESVDADVRRLQGEEIRLGPANTSLPLIVAMDSNSPAYPFPQGSTYLDFMAAGYRDGWLETMPLNPGLTCCQAQLDNNLESELFQRIDLILTFGKVEVQREVLFGASQASKTAGGLWPSDHAGVAAQVVIEKD